MNKLFEVSPHTLTIIPTHQCTASCEQCCFNCNPEIIERLSLEKIKRYIDETMSSFTTIKVLVISGGECFLLRDDLTEIIKHASKYNLDIRVISNGYWASSYDTAHKKLSSLVAAGLTELNFSTGDNHQKYVKIENIINGIKAAYDLGLTTICVNVETPPNARFTILDLTSNPDLKMMIENKRLLCIAGAWMYFKKNTSGENDTSTIPKSFQIIKRGFKPCDNILRGITINPYSQLLACCGLTVEYNKYLKLGNVECKPIKELYEQQYNDFFKIWLSLDGPERIYEAVMDYCGMVKEKFPHECQYCIEIITHENNLKVFQEVFQKELPSILYRFKIKNAKFKTVGANKMWR